MQKLKFLIPLALFLGAFFVACEDDDPFESSLTAEVSFAGLIMDENGDAVQGALVQAGDEAAITDANGVFLLKPVRLPAGHAMVTVKKAGYFEISRPYIVADESIQTITIQLLTKKVAGSVDGAGGGLVNVPGGPSLNFPANAVTDENGIAYTGAVNVFARYLDPSDPNLGLFLPGDMTAENVADEEVFLATYGMIGVEIETPSGKKLKIASGKTVELRMPISPSQAASAPSEIPLWHYDLEEGHWKEDGVAQKVGNEYVGNVSHFSFWNCDAPFPLTQLHGQIFIAESNIPVANATVTLTMVSTGSSSFGYSDLSGKFGGCIPKDEVLTLVVSIPDQCGSQVLYTQTIGPFSGETTLPPIYLSVNSADLASVSGKLVNCSGQAITNGYAKIELGNTTQIVFSNSTGNFELNIINCNNATQAGKLIGYDLAELLESSPVTFSLPPNEVNLGNISVCTALTEYFEYTLDGQQVLFIETTANVIPDSVSTTGVFIQISAFATNQDWIQIRFPNPVYQPGTYPLTGFFIPSLSVNLPQNTLSTTVTSTGNVGDFIVGTFGTSFLATDGSFHTIGGSYRVIRE